jgi:2-dehydro-3-deoxyglucarate aldolase/4-hydroxy-2-oxoheptanedioate aldolase
MNECMNESASRHDPNRLGLSFRERLKRRDLLLGGIVMEYLRPSIVKTYRQAGFDFIYIENEHALFSGPALADFIQCARDNQMPVICKVGQLERDAVARLLDAGVVGIQLPRSETRDEMLQLINFMKFHPHGSRAGAPCFGNVDYQPPADDRQWLETANEATVLAAHIETQKGYENAEQIISTPGVDMVYVGPYDLSIALGHPGKFDHPAVKQAMMKMLAWCKQYNVPFGTTVGSLENAADLVRQGCTFFEMIDELSLLLRGASNAVDSYRKLKRAAVKL